MNPQNLAQHPQVAAMIYQILVPAMATGLSEEQAEAIYCQICRHYAQLDSGAYPAWREDMIKILNLP